MTSKRILALLIAALMLIALFSSCSTTPIDDGQTPNDDDQNQPDEKIPDEDTPDDVPEEKDVKTISWLGAESYQWEYTMREGQNFATWKELMRIALDDYKLTVDWSYVDSTAYETTLNGFIASNTIPDSFMSQARLQDSIVVDLIEGGKFAPINEILEYSEEAAALFEDGGGLEYLKAWATAEDGNWYYIKVGNNTSNSIDLSNSTYSQRVSIQVHGAYGVNIRQDWLDKLNLAMPETLEQFQEALLKMQQEDVNGDGVKNERMITHLGAPNNSTGIYLGVAQWFGLPSGNYRENPGTGVIEQPHTSPGYKDFLVYMNSLYNDQLIYGGDGGSTWNYGTYCGSNEVSAYTMMQDYLWRTNTGDENADYEPMPIIQAVEGITPRFIAQESVAGGAGITFRWDIDYETAARFIDFTHSQKFAMVFEYGIEGVAYDWVDENTLIQYDLAADMNEYKGARAQYLTDSGLPAVHINNIWGVNCTDYKSVDEALAAGEPYTEEFTDLAGWQEKNEWDDISPCHKFLNILSEFGQENFNPTLVYSFVTLPTSAESVIMTNYKTDLDTYLLEMTTNAIMGHTSIDTIDDSLQYAYDNLHLQEYLDMMQTRYNRFLVAMGYEAVPIG